MKPRTILACLFATYGVIQTYNGIFTALGVIGGAMFSVHYGVSPMKIIGPYLIYLIPLFVGVAFICLARRLGALTARIAGVGDDELWEVHMNGQLFLTLLLAATGVYLIVTEGSAMVRIVILSFEERAGGSSTAEAASQRMPDGSQIIAHGVCVLLAAALSLKSRKIANALVSNSNDA